ncbi:sigma factor-like helix-turn-helix DNA-binding protein [Litchfieldia alkalitelluris]|uniref:sigma factor-like helix-turn-helix DNA-binding protein n=1 Tax=Litchfieldia alkalitelluris TaxID=304268 RepID=UPI000997E65B|nr:sigma factor-like helix-turn-helix DNA-binding protein [Litchfieldia alkalitelluris]
MTAKLRLVNREDQKSRLESDNKHDFLDLYSKLQRYCYFLSKNKWDGEDLAQETIAKAWKQYPKKCDITSALLNKIAYHQWVDQLRKKKEIITDDNLEQHKSASFNIDNLMYSAHLLLQLTPNQAVSYLLKEAFLYKSKEIAEMMDTTEMAVKASLHRAKKRLEKLKEDEEENVEANEEIEELVYLFQTALLNEDPSVLIKAIPTLRSLDEIQVNLTPKPSAPFTLSLAA